MTKIDGKFKITMEDNTEIIRNKAGARALKGGPRLVRNEERLQGRNRMEEIDASFSGRSIRLKANDDEYTGEIEPLRLKKP